MHAQAEGWQLATAAITVLLVMMTIGWMVWQRLAVRRQATRRIAAARVRSGHVPLEIPTVRGSIAEPDSDSPETLPEWFVQGDGVHPVVDECPVLRLRYIDVNGKKVESTMQVKYLDLKKQLLSGYSRIPGDMRDVPLKAITGARMAGSGKRFDLATWIDAVRVARRRRDQG